MTEERAPYHVGQEPVQESAHEHLYRVVVGNKLVVRFCERCGRTWLTTELRDILHNVFLICLVTLVVKLTFWPVCTGASACDGWTVAGLVGAILGVSVAFLGILGAIALAAWWLSLEDRVENRVTQLFATRIQTVQDTIDQLNGRTEELRAKVDAIEEMIPALQLSINIAQQSAQIAREETEPSYAQRVRAHEQQRLQMNADQQEQPPDAQ